MENKPVLEQLAVIIANRMRNRPDGSYTAKLMASGANRIRQKIGEEAVELSLAKTRDEIVAESSDLLYHWLVLLEYNHIPLQSVFDELQRRMNP